MFMPTETIQQRERCYVKKCRCLTTALGNKAVTKICMKKKPQQVVDQILSTVRFVITLSITECIILLLSNKINFVSLS